VKGQNDKREKMTNYDGEYLIDFFYKMGVSFWRFFSVGVFKTVAVLFLLWLFEDYIGVVHKTLWRFAILMGVFMVSFFAYHYNGFAK
jgi:hypothetical protein